MAKAFNNLHHPIPASMLVTLARQKALNAVKLDLRHKGFKPWYMERKDLVAAAKAYLNEHPELWAEAKVLALKICSEKDSILTSFFSLKTTRCGRRVGQNAVMHNAAFPTMW